jgi:lysyl-tRNA synthetase class 2
MQWLPTASFSTLIQRAALIARVRDFFKARGILEVETPLLSHSTIPDPSIESFQVGNKYLQTSPEFAMKRLLAAGSGPIYQICKAFRKEECGPKHEPEFTILEWYRPGFSLEQLMQETQDFISILLPIKNCIKITYQDLFLKYLSLDPLTASLEALQACVKQLGIDFSYHDPVTDKDVWLALLMTHGIEPKLVPEELVMVYNYPISQAALARPCPHNPQVAERVEAYYHGLELANGFCELTNAVEQEKRFILNQHERAQLSLHVPPLDQYFLAALAHGLPACSGIALGLDRMLMLVLKTKTLQEVLSFSAQNA